MESLSRHLIPELSDMVLEYCWKEKRSSCASWFYGDYESVIVQRTIPMDAALSFACLGGYRKMIDILLNSKKWLARIGSAGLSTGLYSACERGYTDIVNLLIDTSADIETWGNIVLNCGLEGACIGRHMDLVQYMIKKGATLCCDEKNCLYIQALEN